MNLPLPIGSILAITAFVLAIVELGLTAYLESGRFTPSQISFMLFNSIWTLVVLVYIALSPLYFPAIFNQLISLGLSAVTTLFWFAGSIALAVLFQGCGRGDGNWCGSGKAAIVFGFFLWLVFTAITVIDGLAWSKGRATPPKGPQANPGV